MNKKLSLSQTKYVTAIFRMYSESLAGDGVFYGTSICNDVGISPMAAKFMGDEGLIKAVESSKGSVWCGKPPTQEDALRIQKMVSDYVKNSKSHTQQKTNSLSDESDDPANKLADIIMGCIVAYFGRPEDREQ